MKAKELTDSQKALRGLGGAMLVGIFGVFVYAAHAGGKEGFLAIVSVGVLLAGASALVGGALGFLFGIPRTLQQEGGSPSAEANPEGAEAGGPTHRIDYRVNTNLEQISDWLTKILVGVSLTQISEIRDGLVVRFINTFTNNAIFVMIAPDYTRRRSWHGKQCELRWCSPMTVRNYLPNFQAQ